MPPIPLPERILPESFRGHSAASLNAAAKTNWRLLERAHYDAARFLAHVWEQPQRYGYSSAIDYAEAEWHVRGRQAYFLLQVERDTRNLPELRAAWAAGKVSFSNLREVVKIATPQDDARWTDLAIRLPYRKLHDKVHGKADAEAALGERPWVDTKLSGELGRPDPHRAVERPINNALAALEKRVHEKHNRAAGQHTSWSEFFEAALVMYEFELDRMEREMPEDVRRILARAGYRCPVPHCGRRSHFELHHKKHRSQLGGDEDANRCPLCSAHHRAEHAGLLEVTGDPPSGFRFRHRDTPGGPWQDFPEGGDGPYDPLERAWDGPTYVRERPDHAYGTAPVIKNRRRVRPGSAKGLARALHARLE